MRPMAWSRTSLIGTSLPSASHARLWACWTSIISWFPVENRPVPSTALCAESRAYMSPSRLGSVANIAATCPSRAS